MGQCASALRHLREEAQADEEVAQHKQRQQQPTGQQKQEEHAAQLLKQPRLSAALPHRLSQEESLAHLVRHPRLVPFSAAAAGFGLETAYEPLSLLGRGGTGQVWLARERATGHLRALKLHQRPIPRASVRLAFNEVEVGAGVCASNVFLVHLVEAVLTPSHLALVLEYEAGGSLAELVARQIPVVSPTALVVDEDHARLFFRQLIAGLGHLHAHHTAHRDVKLDNTLSDGQWPPLIKLADFQFAKRWGAPRLTRVRTHLGTAVYMSPELIENRQSRESYNPEAVDVWAAGIWLVALCCGSFPFDNRPGSDDTAAEMQILRQELSGAWTSSKFVQPYLGGLSADAIDLLNKILHVDPQHRIDLEGIQAHPWFCAPLPPPLQAGWQRAQQAQRELDARLAGLRPNQEAVQARNSLAHQLVREAAAWPEHWDQSLHRLAQASKGSESLINLSSIPRAARINLQPEAVAHRLPDRALALLDELPRTPQQRFSLPPDASSSSRASSAAAGNASSAGDLRQLTPFASAALQP